MRKLALLFLASCAADTSKLEARMHDLEREMANVRTMGDGPCHDVTVPGETKFDALVPVQIGETHLHDGDRIVIDEVRGTSPSLAINGLYQVRGKYTLASADEASLGFTVRAQRRGDGCTSGSNGPHIVKRGSGTFELTTRIAYEGDASISFFRNHPGVTTRDDEIGAVYFGHVGDRDDAIGARATKAVGRATCKPVDISFPQATTFPVSVPFEVGHTDLHDGDRITITDVHGTRADFAIDGIYLVRGDYTLSSADDAVIGLNVTGGCTSGTDRGHVAVKKGSGKFEVAVKIAYVGQPHVTFYVNGQGSGGVYFGKGDYLYK